MCEANNTHFVFAGLDLCGSRYELTGRSQIYNIVCVKKKRNEIELVVVVSVGIGLGCLRANGWNEFKWPRLFLIIYECNWLDNWIYTNSISCPPRLPAATITTTCNAPSLIHPPKTLYIFLCFVFFL